MLDKEAEEATIYQHNLLLGLKNKHQHSWDSSRSASNTKSDATIADKDKDTLLETAGLSNNKIVAKIYHLWKYSRCSKDTKEGKQEVKEMIETFKAVHQQKRMSCSLPSLPPGGLGRMWRQEHYLYLLEPTIWTICALISSVSTYSSWAHNLLITSPGLP